MPAQRKRENRNYTILSNDLLTDKRLSFRARGIAAYLLSKPDDWDVRISIVCKNGREDEGSVRAALAELADYGYLVRRHEEGKRNIDDPAITIADFPAFVDEGTPKQRWMGIDSSSMDRGENASQARTMSYSEYLQTEHWEEIRKNALKQAHYRCQICNAKVPLDVHHRTYARLGHEYLADVIALCKECHNKFHDRLEKLP